ncbi:MAG TPA: YciI family protein [Acidobacteriota bacterium]|nr:YciI family protein [Acidobacteriota bacterium]
MKYFAAFLRMNDIDRNTSFRQQHIDFLQERAEEGSIFAQGRFADNSGGLVIYIAQSLEDAAKIAASDPYVVSGARVLEIHEWNMNVRTTPAS